MIRKEPWEILGQGDETAIVAREVVSVWAGHAADNTQTSNVYTHFSPEFMKAQALKVDYNI